MCLSPYHKKNPNYGLKNIGYNYLKDCDSQYIDIPCGHCVECIAVKQMYLVQRVQMEAKKNYLFFATLTYDNKHLPVITTSTGYDIRYADIHHLQLMFMELRNKKLFPRPFRYFAVSELGTKGGRPHFHILFFVPKYNVDGPEIPFQFEKLLFDVVKEHWHVNIGSKKKPIYESRFTYVRKWIHGQLRSNYDFHYVRPFRDLSPATAVAFYVLKYMVKPSDRSTRLQQALHLNLPSDEYDDVWSLVRPRWIASLGFGLNGCRVGSSLFIDNDLVKYLHDGIDQCDKTKGYPLYRNPDTAQTFPLAPFFRRKSQIYSLAQAHDLFYNKSDVLPPNDLHLNDYLKIEEFKKRVLAIDSHDDSVLFDELL